jgi:hypothetical protein
VFWFLLWMTLIVGAVVTLALIVRSVWIRAMALLEELAEATERLGAAAADLPEPRAWVPDEPAVLHPTARTQPTGVHP